MKKINLLLLFVGILGMTFISSCTPDEKTDVKPTISFSSNGAGITGDVTVAPSAPLAFIVSAGENPSTKKNLKDIRVQSWKDNTPNIDTTITINAPTYANTFNFNARIQNSKTEKFTFTVTDKAGESVAKSFTITTEDAVVLSPDLTTAASFTMVRCGSANDPVKYGMQFDQVVGTSPNFSARYINTVDKMVAMTSSEWSSLITQEDLATAVDNGTAITTFDLNLNNSGAIDYYVATKDGSNYTFVHFTAYSSSSEACGTEYTITGEYKE